ncbi:MAG TPA: TlpA disulfide reductase family protein [Opitutaceae bacterium]|nr:TlpA disulfide reductase family protein [Opitutaceae bacterium]
MSAQSQFSGILRGAAAAALAALACALPAQVAPGSPFPALSATGPNGGPLPETAGKVVLVDFWASWCAPCKASFPVYSKLNAAYADRGLVIVAVSVDESPSAYAAFVARLKPPFATLHDSRQALVREVQVPTMPTSYLVDRGGKVRFVHPGFHGEQTERELRREIEVLLGEKAPSP